MREQPWEGGSSVLMEMRLLSKRLVPPWSKDLWPTRAWAKRMVTEASGKLTASRFPSACLLAPTRTTVTYEDAKYGRTLIVLFIYVIYTSIWAIFWTVSCYSRIRIPKCHASSITTSSSQNSPSDSCPPPVQAPRAPQLCAHAPGSGAPDADYFRPSPSSTQRD